MKKYLADILTFSRIIIAVVLLVMAFTGGDLAIGFILFIVGELTDAFDGTCATKWPFPKNKVPKYRKYAAKYDMLADALLAVAMLLFFTHRVNWIAGLIIGVGYSITAIIIDFIVYGKVMGHPDDCTDNSLIKHNYDLAKRIILTRRMVYLALIAISSAWTFYASNWPMAAKIAITVIAVIVSLFLWFFEGQRRHHISRDAVDIEKQLSQKSKKSKK